MQRLRPNINKHTQNWFGQEPVGRPSVHLLPLVEGDEVHQARLLRLVLLPLPLLPLVLLRLALPVLHQLIPSLEDGLARLFPVRVRGRRA